MWAFDSRRSLFILLDDEENERYSIPIRGSVRHRSGRLPFRDFSFSKDGGIATAEEDPEDVGCLCFLYLRGKDSESSFHGNLDMAPVRIIKIRPAGSPPGQEKRGRNHIVFDGYDVGLIVALRKHGALFVHDSDGPFNYTFDGANLHLNGTLTARSEED